MTENSNALKKRLDDLGVKRVQSPPGAPVRVMVGGRPIKPQGEKQDPRPQVKE